MATPRRLAASENASLLCRACVLAVVLISAFVCIRLAVAARAERDMRIASVLWPDHPEVLRQNIMLNLARASAAHSRPSAATLAQIRMLSETEPLAAEPFAIEAALALREAKDSRSEQLLVAARQRDPRNRAVRFLLATTYLHEARIEPALQELVTLAQLSPEVEPTITSALAAYARVPGALPRLQRTLSAHPELSNALLVQLAKDPRNTGLILSLAAPIQLSDRLAGWQERMISSLVEAKDYRTAFELWQRFSTASRSEIGDFSTAGVNSPFAWTLMQSEDGFSNPDGSRLSIGFSGRSDAVLATKVLMLAPGVYELRFQVSNPSSDTSSLHWAIGCLSTGSELANVPVASSSSGLGAFKFHVPVGCGAERLQLKGFTQAYPADLTTSLFNLTVRNLR